jgi:transcriptional regulator with XRE-family HTH domain
VRETAFHGPGMTANKQRDLTDRERATLDRIGQRLAEINLSWAELARRVGRSHQLGSAWSGKRSFPPERVMDKIAEVLDVPRAWLLSGDDPQAQMKPATVNEAEALALIKSLPAAQQAVVLSALRGMVDGLRKK